MDLHPIDIALHLVNLAVLYLLLRVLIWKPVRKFLAAREERIQSQLDQAAELRRQAESEKAEYDGKLAEAGAACEKIVAEGRKTGAEAARHAIDGAQLQAGQLLEQARTDAAIEKQRVLDSAKEDLADLAVDMAGRILRFEDVVKARLAAEDKQKVGTRQGVLKVAHPCGKEELAAIKGRLENLLGCHLELQTQTDESLVGGFAAYVDGKVYDFSYAAQLHGMKQKLS